MNLGATERALLNVITHGDWTSTADASQAVVTRLNETGHTLPLATAPPWFGLSEASQRLERFGLAEIDPGVAEFLRPGEPAPTGQKLLLRITEDGVHFLSEPKSELDS